MTNDFDQRANRNAALRWGGIVVGLLSLQVAGGIYAIHLATGDPSVAVIPDYHQKALNWDDQVALQQQSRELGWSVDLKVISLTSGNGLRVDISDSTNDKIQFNRGKLQMYHQARAGDVKQLTLPAGSTGPFNFPDCFDREGIWQVELDVIDIDGNRFVESNEIVVSSTAPAEST